MVAAVMVKIPIHLATINNRHKLLQAFCDNQMPQSPGNNGLMGNAMQKNKTVSQNLVRIHFRSASKVGVMHHRIVPTIKPTGKNTTPNITASPILFASGSKPNGCDVSRCACSGPSGCSSIRSVKSSKRMELHRSRQLPDYQKNFSYSFGYIVSSSSSSQGSPAGSDERLVVT